MSMHLLESYHNFEAWFSGIQLFKNLFAHIIPSDALNVHKYSQQLQHAIKYSLSIHQPIGAGQELVNIYTKLKTSI